MVLVKKLRFFHLLFLCKIDREKVFFDSLDRKTSRFSLWKPRLKNDAKLHFSKGVSQWFSSKKGNVFMKNRPRKSVLLIEMNYIAILTFLCSLIYFVIGLSVSGLRKIRFYAYTPRRISTKKNQFPKKPGFPLSALITLDWSNTDRLLFKKESVINRVCLAISKRATVTWKKLRS